MRSSWSVVENELIVADYFDMLSKEIAGIPFNKAEHNRRLAKIITGRQPKAIEFKHQNISAICIENGIPYVDGYKPRSNYQRSLRDVVINRVSTHQALLDAVDADVSSPMAPPTVDDILASLEAPPDQARRRPRSPSSNRGVTPQPSHNYLEREAANRALGREGELFVVRFEQARLLLARRERLASQIEHVAEVRGDGDGFDVLSFEASGADRLIEVKTTRYGKQTPFFVTRNELRVSERRRREYQVYRVFSFRHSPKLFSLPGAISETCQLDAAVFVARV